MLDRIRAILEMIKFSHTLFALPFAVLSAVWATQACPGWSWWDVVLILPAMVFARSTAMAFNRIADRHIDAANPRTATRHLPAGVLRPGAVWAFLLICAGLFVATTALFSNPWPLRLSGPVFVFLCLYSFTKRWTSLSHFWLGAALGLSPVCVWVAIGGRIDAAPVLLGLAVLSWVGGFDIIYSLQDADFDRAAGLRSIPAWLGVRGALWVARVSHALMVVCLAALPWLFPLGWLWLAGVAAVGLLLVYEHAIVRPDRLDRVNVAFFHVNIAVSVWLMLLGSADALLGLGPLAGGWFD